MHGHSPGVVLRSLVIGLTAFLTVVDLFATQAILPSLTRHYNVTPAAMGFAVNASTMGMAVAGLVVGFLSPHIDRRLGILWSLVVARDPHHAAGERPRSDRVHDPAHCAGPVHGVGVCADAGLSRRAMQFDGRRRRVRCLYHRQRRQQSDRPAGFGGGRRHARAGLELLLLCAAQSRRRGAGLLHHPARQADACDADGAIAVRGDDRALAQSRAPRSAFAIGFCILFAFIGTFTFVNFVLVRAPLSLGRMDLGFVYFVFAPSVVTTLFAGKAVARFGTRPAIWGALAVAAIGLPLMLSSHLPEVLTGMVLVGVGTFFAQACATGFVGQAAQRQPRRRQRDLSRLLFPRRPRRQRRARPVVRPFRMDCLRRRHLRITCGGRMADKAP